MRLALDACATLHAKQLAHATGAPLRLLEIMGRGGVQLVTTPRVSGEQLTMSLSATHKVWRDIGCFDVQRVSVGERRQVRNRLLKRMTTPGDKDIGLIALAVRLSAVLLTHDDAAAALAARCKLVAVDLLDLADLACQRGWWSWEEAETSLAALPLFAWRPHDLHAQGVRATVERRPRRDRLLRALHRLLDR